MEKKGKYTFEQAMQRLEEIVAKLESGDTPLEETIQLFQEGMELVNFCNKKLEEVKHKVEMVVRTKEGYTLVPFEQKNNEEITKPQLEESFEEDNNVGEEENDDELLF